MAIRATVERWAVTALFCLCLFLAGVAFAAVAPYRGIVAIEQLGLSNATFALILTIGSVIGAGMALVLGYLSDRARDRRILVLVTALAGALAYGLLYAFPSQWLFVATTILLLPFAGAVFSQLLAYTRSYYNARQPEQAEFMMSMQRTLFSAAWVIIPPVAGWLASTWSVFVVYLAATLAHIGIAAVFLWLLRLPDAQLQEPLATAPTPAARIQLPLASILAIIGVTGIRAALIVHLSGIPLGILNDFHGTLHDVGVNASVAALLEVPLMIGWAYALRRVSKVTILVGNGVLYGVYLMLLAQATTMTQVYLLQGLNAIATAALMSITISYVQDLIKGYVGLSTSLLDATTVVATAVSSLIFGWLAVGTAYRGTFFGGGVVALLGAGILFIAHRWGERTAQPDDQTSAHA